MKNLYWVEKGVLGLRINIEVLKQVGEKIGLGLEPNQKYNGSVLFLRGLQSDYIIDGDQLTLKHHFSKLYS